MLGLLSFSCHSSELGMGFLEPASTENGQKTLHSNIKINEKSTIDVQYIAKTGETTCCQRMRGSSFKYLGESSKLYIGDSAKGFMYEASDTTTSEKPEEILSVAIINADSTAPSHLSSVVAIKRKTKYLFEQCNGTEGVNLYEKKGERTLARIYFFLNYDIEETCQKDNISKGKP